MLALFLAVLYSLSLLVVALVPRAEQQDLLLTCIAWSPLAIMLIKTSADGAEHQFVAPWQAMLHWLVRLAASSLACIQSAGLFCWLFVVLLRQEQLSLVDGTALEVQCVLHILIAICTAVATVALLTCWSATPLPALPRQHHHHEHDSDDALVMQPIGSV